MFVVELLIKAKIFVWFGLPITANAFCFLCNHILHHFVHTKL